MANIMKSKQQQQKRSLVMVNIIVGYEEVIIKNSRK